MKQILGSMALGVACFGAIHALANTRAGEGVVWGMWLLLTAIASYVAGYSWPGHALRSSVLIMMMQPLGVLIVAAWAGEISNPSRSTGGLAGVMIASVLVLAWLPVPMLLAWLAARERRRAALE